MHNSRAFRGAIAAAAIVAGLGAPLSFVHADDAIAQPVAIAERSAQEDVIYTYSDNYPNFARQLETAIGKHANVIRMTTDVTESGTITFPASITRLEGYGRFPSQPKMVNFGYANETNVVFASGSNITVDHINFYRSPRRTDWVGANVRVEKGATVRFSNVNFSNTPVINGTAIFENCTFETGKIENNGSATYTGNTTEPTNTGIPAADVYAPLALSVQETQLTTLVKGSAASQTVAYTLEGTKASSATVTASISDTASGLTASVVQGQLSLGGTALKAGSYTITLTAHVTKDDGQEDSTSKVFTISVVEPIKAILEGELQAYVSVTGKSGSPTASHSPAMRSASAQPFMMRASASGGSSGNLSANTATNKLTLKVAEGETPAVGILDFQRSNPNARVSFEISPAGSGMNASLIYDKVYVNGQPDTPGTYQVTAVVSDGVRSARSNPIPLRIYSGKESLAERFAQLDSAHKDWDMEPYSIPTTGNAVVPTHLANIYGSHESGVYGQIGSGERAYASETLTIPAGANVTLHNMKINSSVRVIVEKGAKLKLVDSVVFGPLDVHGTLSGEDATTTNTVTFHDGSTMENLELDSSAHYLTDGNADAPTPKSPVVIQGEVSVQGANLIQAEEGAASLAGQDGMHLERDAKLKLAEGSSLLVQGGLVNPVYATQGGNGVVMAEGSSITGKGALDARGGNAAQNTAGRGIDGTGTIDVATLTARGGDASNAGTVTVTGRLGTGGDAVSSNVVVRADELNIVAGTGANPGSSSVNTADGNTPGTSNGNESGTQPLASYTVSFYVDDKPYGAVQTIKEGGFAQKPTDPQKPGYVFKHWVIAPTDRAADDMPVVFNFATMPVSRNLRLNAVFEVAPATGSAEHTNQPEGSGTPSNGGQPTANNTSAGTPSNTETETESTDKPHIDSNHPNTLNSGSGSTADKQKHLNKPSKPRKMLPKTNDMNVFASAFAGLGGLTATIAGAFAAATQRRRF
ncbi:hypothetical protein KPC83_01020 [Collinsella sp. zg1085]|uniref:hypothetical protein n=1 Tax=Collinsella sp. zg1085 TaxID=2844380 RepID=UPI001C0D1DE8|nr:hypothetical protein [Collinsella sp. zg1085]QWT17774.1 hypothetical protein KPC83_01020 [Collinsella sp. zg1085]